MVAMIRYKISPFFRLLYSLYVLKSFLLSCKVSSFKIFHKPKLACVLPKKLETWAFGWTLGSAFFVYPASKVVPIR